MPTTLPCLCTVQRNLLGEYYPLSEGDFWFEEFINHLKKDGPPFIVAVSEDATWVLSRVECDNTTNRLVSFVLLCNSEGLPLADSILDTSFEVTSNK